MHMKCIMPFQHIHVNIFTCIYTNIIKSHKACYANSQSITPKISSHGIINKHEQFNLNHSTKHIFTQKYFVNTIHVNGKPSGYCSRPHKIGIFSTQFKAFETEFTAKTNLRTFLTIYMILKQGLTQVGKDPYLLEFSELHQIGAHA